MFARHQTIVIASGNKGKIREIQAILQGHPILPQAQFDVPEAEETGTTFIENAIIKARNAARHAKMAAIADDSGLVVDGLQGAPGVISARYAGANASDKANLQKVLREMQGVPESRRTARFVCVLAFMEHVDDPTPVIVQGAWEGLILEQPSGENGFGYDPIFWVPDRGCSSAQLTPEIKNAISHRGQALRRLTEQLKGYE